MTVLVVIGIAILCVVTFGIAIIAVAAIAGIVSLVLCAADVICMLARITSYNVCYTKLLRYILRQVYKTLFNACEVNIYDR